MNKSFFICLGLLAPVISHAAITGFTNKPLWEQALLSAVIVTEDFEDMTLVDGLSSYTTVDGSFSEIQPFSLIPSTVKEPTFNGSQVFEELADNLETTQWNFSQATIAFGGNWDLLPAGPGTGLSIAIDGQVQTAFIIPATYTGEFWGFIADQAFSQVEILKPSSSGVDETEKYHLDELVFATAVPLPATVWMFFLGLLGLVKYRVR